MYHLSLFILCSKGGEKLAAQIPLNLIHLMPTTPGKSLSSGVTSTASQARSSSEVRFGDLFRSALAGSDPSTQSATAPPATLVASILQLIQGGTPAVSIGTMVADKLASKIATAISASTKTAANALAHNKLAQAFANALAPPGGSPPGSPTEQARTLAQQLLDLVARVAEPEVGQQSGISGQILDANQAKDIPAQRTEQQNAPSTIGDALVSFVQTILSDVTSQVAAANPASVATQITGTKQPVETGAGLVSTQIVATAQPTEAGTAAGSEPAEPSGRTLNPLPVGGAALGTPGTPVDDILARILARALGASAKLGTVTVATQPDIHSQTTATAQSPSSNAASAPRTLPSAPLAAALAGALTSKSADPATPAVDTRASLDHLIASVVDAAKIPVSAQSSNAGGQNAGAFNGTLSQSILSALTSGKSIAPQNSGGASFISQTNALLGGWTFSDPTISQSHGIANALAQSTATLPYTTVDPNSVIDQVIKGLVIKTSADAATSNVSMKLSPEHLGDVALKLTVSGGTVTASMTAQNADVRDVLVANQHHLARSLSDAGLKLSHFSVDVGNGGMNGSSQQQQLAQHAGAKRNSGVHIITDSDDANSTDPIAMAAVPNFGPPAASVSSLELLNYLA